MREARNDEITFFRHRVLKSARFHVAAALAAVVLALELVPLIATSSYRNPAFGYTNTDVFFYSLRFSYIAYAAPMLSALAIGRAVEEYYNNLYDTSSFVAVAKQKEYGLAWWRFSLSGGLSLCLGFLAFALLVVLIFPNQSRPFEALPLRGFWLDVYRGGGILSLFAVQVILAFLFGMVWSGFSISYFVLFKAKHSFQLAPFITCVCLALVTPPRWQPIQMLVQTSWSDVSLNWLLGYQIIAALCFWGIYITVIRLRWK